MHRLKTTVGVTICFVAFLGGLIGSMALGGYGICAADLSLSLIICLAGLGAVSSGTLAIMWPRVWWLGAFIFSLPTLSGICFAATARQWERVGAIAICIVIASFTALVIRYPTSNRIQTRFKREQ